jgi:hypothetical protein
MGEESIAGMWRTQEDADPSISTGAQFTGACTGTAGSSPLKRIRNDKGSGNGASCEDGQPATCTSQPILAFSPQQLVNDGFDVNHGGVEEVDAG